MNDNNSTWRIILSAIVTIFMIGRLAYRCSDMGNHSKSYDNSAELMNSIAKMQEQSRVAMEESKNDLFYKSYKEIDEMPSNFRDSYGILKLDKDSSIMMDLSTKIVIPKNSFFYNNHDDTLRFASKFQDNTAFFVHDFNGNSDTRTLLKSVKGEEISNITEENSPSSKVKMVKYNILKNGISYRGFALDFKEKEYSTLFEFESDSKTKDELKEKALNFLLTSFKE